MGVALYVSLQQPIAEIDNARWADGKSVARNLEDLDRVCGELSLPSLQRFISASTAELEEIREEFGVDACSATEEWFPTEDVLKVVRALP